jgi:hypothetical protein
MEPEKGICMASRTTSSIRGLAVTAAAVLAVVASVLLAALPAQASEASPQSGGYYASPTSCNNQGAWQVRTNGFTRWACNWEPHDPPFHLYLWR